MSPDDTKLEYPPDPIAAFNDGCLMDIRMRVALEFAKAMLGNATSFERPAHEIANHALNTAKCLFDEGKRVGWVEPLPTSGEITEETKRHLERNINCQIHQQTYGQRQQAGAVRPIMNG